MSAVFSSKLDRLMETIALAARSDIRPLAYALLACANEPVVAVGSGGSAITAEFLAACRVGMGHAPTVPVTPMAYVLEAAEPKSATWLFSASGENQDILAAFEMAVRVPACQIQVLTSASDGLLAQLATAAARASSHVAPVADSKDGFLATHSVISAAASLLLASDAVVGTPLGSRVDRISSDAERLLSSTARAELQSAFAPLAGRDTVVLLHDPHLAAAAVLVETSLWEAGICAVQRTDFRNFAHGRHVWMSRHGHRTFVLALTCDRSRSSWDSIRRELPAAIPVMHRDFGRAGRGGLFEALLSALTVVEAAGVIQGVDPGRPGVADFGRRIFDQPDLRDEARQDNAAVRRKRRAEALLDAPGREPTDWAECQSRFLAKLADANISALVLDYDGTVVSTPDRLDPPRHDVLEAIVRLAREGMVIGFATGRGGSIGEMLREHVPHDLHGNMLVGYYNGSHVVPLSVDIRVEEPPPDPSIAEIQDRLRGATGLFVDDWAPKRGNLQVTIPFEKLAGPASIERIETLLREAGHSVKAMRSGHSIDIYPCWGGKLRVVDAAREALAERTGAILRVGDSGDFQGNDFELLEGPLGLSVDRVCDREASCWNLLPADVIGPEGLLRILLALKPQGDGVFRIDNSGLFRA